DLCAFATRTDLAPIVQAGIVHAQFETIHPFADGNGRVGRALIYAVLRRRGEIPKYVPPISLILAEEPKGYVGGLTGYREGGVSSWIAQFADATARAGTEAERLADDIEQLQSTWLDDLGQPRRDAAVRQLISGLPGQPVVDVAVAQTLTGKSHVAVGKALRELESAGILQRLNGRKWGRVWECDQLLNLVDAFEKSVRVPGP
ncbi:MAG: Fic family protein, partial [Solirubrobacteraceae bacterium]